MLNMYSRIEKDGKIWVVTFGIANRSKIKVTAKELNGRRIYTAPKDVKEIADLIPIELWPAFALPLANVAEDTNEQKRLF